MVLFIMMLYQDVWLISVGIQKVKYMHWQFESARLLANVSIGKNQHLMLTNQLSNSILDHLIKVIFPRMTICYVYSLPWYLDNVRIRIKTIK